MAPEMFKEHARPTPLVDLYVLGILGYEMLTGKKAFRGEGMQRAVAQLDTDPAPPAAPVAEYPLYGVVARLLQRNPVDRFQSAEEALLELSNLDTSMGRLWM
jgi:serine/threonine-protein kinase